MTTQVPIDLVVINYDTKKGIINFLIDVTFVKVSIYFEAKESKYLLIVKSLIYPVGSTEYI